MSDRNLHVLRELVAEAWQRVNKMYEQVDEAMRKKNEAYENEIQAQNEEVKYRKHISDKETKLMELKEDARFPHDQELQALARQLDSDLLQDMEKYDHARAMHEETVRAHEHASMTERKAWEALDYARQIRRDHENKLVRLESLLRATRSAPLRFPSMRTLHLLPS